MPSLRPFARTAFCALALLSAGPVLGQGMPHGMTRSESSGEYRAFAASMPLNLMQKQTVARLEFNLDAKASVAVEASMMGNHQEMSDKDQKATGGESQMTQAKGAALIISRYTQPGAMAGFYWSLGAGYRQQQVKWRVHPNPEDKQINYDLVDSGDQMLNHDALMSGTTGHGRAGYRYVGSEYPFIIGAFLGVRHYQAGVKDANSAKDAEADKVAYAPLTDREKDKLVRQYETTPELGIELGIVF